MFRLVLVIIFGVLLLSCEKSDNKTPSFDNTPIAFTNNGQGSPALVFVHGWSTDKSYWEAQVNHFKNNFQVVTLDLAGHGHSGKNRDNWNPENFARDIVAVINRLDLDNVILIGHSISEETIIRAARMEPKKITGIVGVDNFKDVDLEFNDSIQNEAIRFFGLMEKNFRITTEFYANEFLFSPYTKGKHRKRILESVQKADPNVAIPILKLLYTDYQEEKTFLKQLITPIYLINSNMIETDTAALNKYCNHGFVLREMSKVGHFPMIEDPETFNALLEETLEEIRNDDFQRD